MVFFFGCFFLVSGSLVETIFAKRALCYFVTSLTLGRLNVGVREFLVVFCRPQTVGARDQRASTIFEDPTKSPPLKRGRSKRKVIFQPSHFFGWLC